jgi:hypothetical protein
VTETFIAAKLPHRDSVALDLVFLCEVRPHILDERTGNIGRKFGGLASYHAAVPILAGAKCGRTSAPRVPQR